MKLSSRTEYALLALVYLARLRKKTPVKAEEISRAQKIPLKFLEQILLAMKRAAFLKSLKGQQGGYTLAKRPADIYVSDIIRLFDGALAPTMSVSRYFYESTPIEREKKLVRFFKEIRNEIVRKVENTTIADMV